MRGFSVTQNIALIVVVVELGAMAAADLVRESLRSLIVVVLLS